MVQIIRAQGFCPPKIKFTQFLDGFRLKCFAFNTFQRLKKSNQQMTIEQIDCEKRRRRILRIFIYPAILLL